MAEQFQFQFQWFGFSILLIHASVELIMFALFHLQLEKHNEDTTRIWIRALE